MAFHDILGQERACQLFHNALRSARCAQAYLLYGPSGVGKKRLALQVAKALACRVDPIEGCETCPSCRKMSAGNHPDVILVEPEGMSLRIEHIRQVQRRLSYRPYESAHLVVIIDGCEALTAPAANALLKTLEEPPESAVLLLITSNKEALPATIRSRCQLIPCRPLAAEHIATILERQGVPPSQATRMAILAGDHVVSWSQEEVTHVLAQRQEAYHLLHQVSQGHGSTLVLRARQIAGKREPCEAILAWLACLCRDLVLLKVTATAALRNRDMAADLETLAQLFSVEGLLDAFTDIEQLRHYLTMNINPQLIFEHLLIQLQDTLLARVSS